MAEEEIQKDKFAFVKKYIYELKKVVWPTPKETFRNTGITLVMIFVVGVFVFLLDFGIVWLLSLVMNISKS
ncbi:MAG: preprotein translocase subunit SecE [Candidatus Improbicoccus devescovinae]|nr:MAG: preprotein translocase subunit SecE [Candidatus Improbicoccus devescovinae]